MIRDGKALIPPKGYQGKWEVGEFQQWLRIDTAPGQALTSMLYARRRGEPEPTFAILPGKSSVSVTVGGQTDEILLGTSPALASLVRWSYAKGAKRPSYSAPTPGHRSVR
jgi:hypothetical protein